MEEDGEVDALVRRTRDARDDGVSHIVDTVVDIGLRDDIALSVNEILNVFGGSHD